LDVKTLSNVAVEQQLEGARNVLAQYSYTDNPQEWAKLLNKVMSFTIKLNDINKDLGELERNSSCCPYGLFIDIHVAINKGTLSYSFFI
jgi:hypothetical protein